MFLNILRYLDAYPTSACGKIVAVFALLCSVLVIAFPVSIFSELWQKELHAIGELKNLYNEFSKQRKNEQPKQKNIRALREELNDLFPDLLGFGKLYDESKFTDAYQTNRKRAPKPWPYQDSVYWSLSARLDQENMSRRLSIKR